MSWNNENWQEQLEAAQRMEALRRQQDQLNELKSQTEAIKSLEFAQQMAWMNSQREAKAKEIAETRVKAESGDPVAIDRLIWVLQESKQFDESVFWAERGAKLGNIRAINLLLLVRIREQNWLVVKDLIKLAKKTDVFKETSFALTLGGIAHFIQGEMDLAKKEFRLVLDRDDLKKTSLLFLREIANSESLAEDVLKYTASINQASPDETDYTYDLDSARNAFADLAEIRISQSRAKVEDFFICGLVMESRNKDALSDEYFEESSKLGNQFATIRLFEKFARKGELERALRVASEHSTMNEELAAGWVNLANSYIFGTLIPEKRFTAVGEFVSHAKSLNVLNQTTNAITNGAIASFFLGNVEQAISEFNAALDREDRFSEAEASWWLSEIYESNGDKQNAVLYKARSKKAGGHKRPAFLRSFGKLSHRA
jgi:tetratricopeptide (TPR) repeat protein